MLWFRLFGGMLPVKDFKKPNLLNDDPADVSGGTLVQLAATVLALEAKSRRREQMVLDVGKLTRAALEAVWKGRRPSEVAWSRRRQYDVTTNRNAGFLRRRCGGSRGCWRFWCGAAMRVCQTFSVFLKFLMTARILVACSPHDRAIIR